MSYYLFLDDYRNPSDVTWVNIRKDNATIVRSKQEFESTILSLGVPALVSFDHDLGDLHYQGYYLDNNTGYDAAKWLVNYCTATGKPFPKYTVHSMNPDGVERIHKVIEEYYK